MYGEIKAYLQKELNSIKEGGIYKKERIITTPQNSKIKVDTGEEVIIMCANNYLGLSSNLEVIEAAKQSLDTTWRCISSLLSNKQSGGSRTQTKTQTHKKLVLKLRNKNPISIPIRILPGRHGARRR